MQEKSRNDEKPKNDNFGRRVHNPLRYLLLGLVMILWLGFVSLVQFPVYSLLSAYIGDTMLLMNIIGVMSISLYILGVIFFLRRFLGGQSPKLKNDGINSKPKKSPATLAVQAFLWLWVVAIVHILAHTLLPRYFPGIDMQSEFFSFLTPVLYMSGGIFIMYRHYKS